MKTPKQMREQFVRLDRENYQREAAERWKMMDCIDTKARERHRANFQHYVRRSELIRKAYLSSLKKYGERCRAAGMRWDNLKEEYV